MAAFYTRRERKSEKRAKSAWSSVYLKSFNILIISGRFLFFFYLVQSQPCWFVFHQFMQYAYGAVMVALTLNRNSLMVLTIVVRLWPNATDIFFVIKKNETKQSSLFLPQVKLIILPAVDSNFENITLYTFQFSAFRFRISVFNCLNFLKIFAIPMPTLNF